MRILLIHQYFLGENDSGGSRFNELTKLWTNQGHEVIVIAGMVHYASGKKNPEYKGKAFVKEQLNDRLEVIRCHVSESYNTNFIGRLWGYFSFVFSSLYAGIFKTKGKFDVILVTSPPLFVGITGYLLSRVKRIKLVFEIRDLWPESAIDTGVLTSNLLIKLSYWFEGFIYKKATLINVLTPAFRDKLIKDKSVPQEKIIFIPNAADFQLSEKLTVDFNIVKFRLENNLPLDKLILTYVGAHGVANHLIQLVDAAEACIDLPIHFLLIGNGMQKEFLVEEAKAKKLTNITFLPPVSKQKVFEYIMASDVGISVLKKVDTFKTIYSNKTFDYMSCKKPVLMAIDGVSRALVEKANCGYYVEPENIQEYRSVIEQIIKDGDFRNTLGANGYKYAKSNFDREVLAKEYLKQLQSI